MGLGLLYWLRTWVGVVLVRGGVGKLEDLPTGRQVLPAELDAAGQEPRRAGADDPDRAWPPVSVIVPARDEAGTIEAAAETLLAQEYPDLQIVFVDDRSVDGTGAIMDRLATEDSQRRVAVVHVDELPDGWLGKVHALAAGWAASDGEYVLLTDADVHLAPGRLPAAVTVATEGGLDHLAACPAVWPAGAVVDVMVAAFLRQLLALALPPTKVADPNSKAYFGVGAFNLVRREVFGATDGWAWLRMETADDMGVGLLMKQSGARCGVVTAFEHVGLHWYPTVAAAARGAEKGYASMGNCRPLPILGMAVVLNVLESAPLAGVAAIAWLAAAGAQANWPLVTAGTLGAAVVAAFVGSVVGVARWAKAPLVAGLAAPLVTPLVAALMVRVAWLGWRRGGVMWRGRLYPSTALRAGRRVRPYR